MALFDILKNQKLLVWKIFYSQWAAGPDRRLPGYTVLLLIPGDLPVFLKIATEVITSQNLESLEEILIIPDKIPANFSRHMTAIQRRYPQYRFRLVELNRFERTLTGFFNRPAMNCWLQFFRGINATRTTHALWHDADLFITVPEFVEKHYRLCLERQLACLGVNETWDPWFAEQGFDHITATWELMVDVEWVQRFKPWHHLSHKDRLNGGPAHVFDITYLPQCLTPPESVGRHDIEAGFVHFNYVISTYRYFQNSKGPFEDSNFRLLLIRLLVEAYDRGNPDYEIPAIEALPQGLTDPAGRVTYVAPDTKQNYPEFRQNLQKLIDSGFLSREQMNILRRGVQPFDQAFEWPDEALTVNLAAENNPVEAG